MPTDPPANPTPLEATLAALYADVRTAAGLEPDAEVFEERSAVPEESAGFAVVEISSFEEEPSRKTYGSDGYRVTFEVRWTLRLPTGTGAGRSLWLRRLDAAMEMRRLFLAGPRYGGLGTTRFEGVLTPQNDLGYERFYDVGVRLSGAFDLDRNLS